MKIFKEIAQELLELSVGDDTLGWENDDGEVDYPIKFKLIQSELIDTSRWSNIHEVIYQDLTTDKFYSSTYSVGATECQDQSAYDDEGEEITLTEVFPRQVLKTVYEIK